MKIKSNTGRDSIRINGKSIDELPMVAEAHAKQELIKFMKTDRENKIGAIKARYPRASIAYLDSRIEESKLNMKQTLSLRTQEETRISDYMGHISLCRHRDKLIAKLDPSNETDANMIKKLRKEYPLYNVAAMEQQIKQSRQALTAVDEVMQKEQDSIVELKETIVRCQQRDLELKKVDSEA